MLTSITSLLLGLHLAFAGPAVIWSGPNVKTLKPGIDINGQAQIQSGTTDPTSVAVSAPKGSLYLNTSNANVYRKNDAGLTTNWTNLGSGSGTVTSVGISLPADFTVTGSPVTTTGTLTATYVSQTANTVFAAPNGSAGTPSFRALVNADLPLQTSSAGTERIERLRVASSCTVDPCTITSQTGSWVTAVNRTTAGSYVIHFASAFSVAPTCSVTLTGGGFICTTTGTTTTTVSPTCFSTGGALTDSSFDVICMGAK